MCIRGPPHPTLFFAFSLFTSGQSVYQDPVILSRRAVPEIAGSQGGFIGLVVALGVLILICCVAVFFLLRNHEPSDQDRASRRERYRHQRDRGRNVTTATTNISSFGDKVRGMWAEGPRGGNGSRNGGRRGGRGWIRAGSGDEWETHSDRDEERGAQPMKPFAKPFEETLQETDSPLSDATSGVETYAPAHYTGPYTQDSSRRAPSHHVSFVRSQSPLPLSGSPVLSGSLHQEADEDEDEVRPPGHRHFSTQSSTSVRTFEGGTKFIESL